MKNTSFSDVVRSVLKKRQDRIDDVVRDIERSMREAAASTQNYPDALRFLSWSDSRLLRATSPRKPAGSRNP